MRGERWVQGCVLTVSIPRTLDQFAEMARQQNGKWMSNLELLLSIAREDDVSQRCGCWTGPRWLSEGDIVFFYYAATTRRQIPRLLTQARARAASSGLIRRLLRRGHDRDQIEALKRLQDLADTYAGTIFACAEVEGAPYNEDSDATYYRSRVYVPFRQLHAFEHPLPSTEFEKHVRISRQATNTPVCGGDFDGLVRLLAKRNALPSYLQQARGGSSHFQDVNETTWRTVACDPATRFLHEAELRSYLLDFFLAELKDPDTPLLCECQCYRRSRPTGIADYFVAVNGQWIPVEAKLNVLAERALLRQVAKYIDITSFVPTKGEHRGEQFKVSRSKLSLIVDQFGAYLVIGRRMFNCAPGEPLLKREQFSSANIQLLRQQLGQAAS